MHVSKRQQTNKMILFLWNETTHSGTMFQTMLQTTRCSLEISYREPYFIVSVNDAVLMLIN